MIINKRNIYTILLYIYVLTSIIIPSYYLNKIIFIIIFVMYIFDKTMNSKLKTKIKAPIYILLIYTYGLYISQFNIYDIVLIKQIYLITLSLFLIYIIKDYNINYKVLLLTCGKFFILISLFLYYFYANNYNINLLNFFIKYGLIGIGERNFGKISLVMFHLGTVPILYLISFLFLKEKKYIWLTLSLIISFLSTSRALILGIFIMILYVKFSSIKYSTRIILGILSLVMIGCSLYFILKYTTIFSLKEYGNNIKMGHILSYFDILNLNNLCFGNGLATLYYSKGFGKLVGQTEVTLIDSIRYFGVPLGLILYWLILFPFITFKDYNKEKLPIFFIYLLMAMTNPILFNSFGVLVILWYWSEVEERKNKYDTQKNSNNHII